MRVRLPRISLATGRDTKRLHVSSVSSPACTDSPLDEHRRPWLLRPTLSRQPSPHFFPTNRSIYCRTALSCNVSTFSRKQRRAVALVPAYSLALAAALARSLSRGSFKEGSKSLINVAVVTLAPSREDIAVVFPASLQSTEREELGREFGQDMFRRRCGSLDGAQIRTRLQDGIFHLGLAKATWRGMRLASLPARSWTMHVNPVIGAFG